MSRRRWPFRRLRFYLAVLIITLSSFLFLACGSGGGGGSDGPQAQVAPSSSVSGVAATGAAIVGDITVKDSTGAVIGTVATDADGNYSIDVTGFTPPYYIYATDGVNELYSVAFDSGLANVNPATNLALALIFGADLEAVFDDPASNPVTQGEVDAVGDEIGNALDLIFEAYGVLDVNPFTDPFEIGNDLDQLFDDLKVEIDPSSGDVIFRNVSGGIVGTTNLSDFQNFSDEIGLSVSGNGFVNAVPPWADLNLTIDDLSISTSELAYSFRGTIFSTSPPLSNASITEVNALGGIVTIIGTCSLGGVDYTFTATVNDGPNEMGMEILDNSEVVHPDSVDSQPISGGAGFIITIEESLPAI